MASREDLIEHLGESFGYANIIVERKLEQFKLTAAEKSASTISGVITGVILGFLGFLVFLFALIALAFLLAGGIYKVVATGFGIVAAALLVLLLLIYLFRRPLIVNPTVTKVIGTFFTPPAK